MSISWARGSWEWGDRSQQGEWPEARKERKHRHISRVCTPPPRLFITYDYHPQDIYIIFYWTVFFSLKANAVFFFFPLSIWKVGHFYVVWFQSWRQRSGEAGDNARAVWSLAWFYVSQTSGLSSREEHYTYWAGPLGTREVIITLGSFYNDLWQAAHASTSARFQKPLDFFSLYRCIFLKGFALKHWGFSCYLLFFFPSYNLNKDLRIQMRSSRLFSL